MTSKYIQFRGIESVLKAYDMRNIECWAIFNGKEMFTKGSGADELSQFLEMLQETSCTYTLKVYEDIPLKEDGAYDLKVIKDKTPSDGAFTFKLINEQEDYGPWTLQNNRNKLLQRVTELEQWKKDRELEDEEDFEEEESIEDVVIGAIREPSKLLEFVNTVKGIFGISPVFVPGASIGNVQQQSTQPAQWSANDVQRIGEIIDVLRKHDEKIVDHLEKLSKIAINNPGQFNFLINALNDM